MDLSLEPGVYVVAVSGGVDSVVLLHMLQSQPGMRLTVAHFDHGIRVQSKQDRLFVQELAELYGLPMTYDEGGLGPGASEATARAARYKFLYRVRQASGAQAILTAHHRDDLLETAILNILRGTGRRGLASLGSGDGLERPLLHFSKKELLRYAQEHNLQWREDETNQDEAYQRNYIRHRLLSRLDDTSRAKLAALIKRQRALNMEIDGLLINHLHVQPGLDVIDRRWFSQLPHDVAKELLAAWFRLRGLREFEAKTLERAATTAKVGRVGAVVPLKAQWRMDVGEKTLALKYVER